MNKTIYLLNIGNTHTRIALLQDQQAVFQRSMETRMLARSEGLAEMERGTDIVAMVACVVPAAADMLYRRYGRRALFLKPHMIENIDFSPVDTTTVGADRLANIAAAASLGTVPMIIADCGTAITTEILDAERKFRGGVILPGRRLARQALKDHTALLPLVELSDDPLHLPWGTNTRGAIRTGVDLGTVGALERILKETQAQLGGARIMITGGDAPFFVRHLDGVEAAPEDFTLHGLAQVAIRHFV
jgi:type III pantothenate kinase